MLVFTLSVNADEPLCPANAPTGPIVAYEDGFSSGWSSSGSWGVTITDPSVPGGQNGSSALKANFSAPWTGVEFHRSNLTTTGRNMLAFRIRKEAATGDVFVGIHKVSPDAVESYVRATSYLVPNQSTPFTAGAWYSVLIPLSDLGAEGVPINGIVFQNEFSGVVYVEDVILINMPPNFKLPLPGNKNWLLTVEAGGKAYDGGTDTNHSETAAYFSIDFDDTSQQSGQETDVKILASAGGKVFFASTTEDQYNGYYVVIDHDGDGNIKTGYSTWYAHMKEGSILVSAGNTVTQGQQLGIMGNTGESTGASHLHFGVQYKNKKWLKKSDGTTDGENAMFLRLIKIEGKKIEEYKVGVGGSDPAGYYPSTNLQ